MSLVEFPLSLLPVFAVSDSVVEPDEVVPVDPLFVSVEASEPLSVTVV